MQQFGPDFTVDESVEEMRQLRDLWEEYDEDMEVLLEEYEVQLGLLYQPNVNKKNEMLTTVRNHRKFVADRVAEVKTATIGAMSAFEKASLELNQQQLDLAQDKAKEETEIRNKEEFYTKVSILAKALTKYNAIIDEANKINEDVEESVEALDI